MLILFSRVANNLGDDLMHYIKYVGNIKII